MRSYVWIFTAACLICAAFASADWPDWRGPTQEGHCDDANLPLHWSETENIAWKTEIHDIGLSTPVVWGNQIWLTTAVKDGTVLYAVCVDVESGKIVYDIPVFKVESPQHINPTNSYATPSATIEAGRVYVHYGSLGTACIDTANGETLWKRTDLNCDHMQGPASSPILFEDLVILTIEGTDKQFMVGLNKKTGETVWTYNRPAELYTPDIQPVYLKSYQTPIIINVEGKPQLVSNGALMATGHDPRTGTEIWRVLYRDDSTISRIVTGHGLMFINTGGNPGGTQLYAVRQGGVGDVTNTHVVWKMMEDAPHESSPVLVGDLLYTVGDKSAMLICSEAETGKQVWSQKMPRDIWASLLANKDHIYMLDRKGKTTVIAAGREYRELAVNQLDGEFLASPAVAGDSLLLRTKTHLYRIVEK
ncbi:MAG: PQQ-like beta-propeller repeat protein [Candidatus Hydrogenedentes bacterium]|nr:PQQ-like beta-propeller repeat protein [Candidatus Hydrogenedentota bacterium]